MSDADLLDRLVRWIGEGDADVNPEATGTTRKIATFATVATTLIPLYGRLPAKFPSLYEQLVLSYRWHELDFEGVGRLLSNPPEPTLETLFSNITADPVFVEVLFPLGLIPFAKASDGCYDPLCFDTMRCDAMGDCPVARVEHEAVLCNMRLGKTSQVAPSFRRLVESIIETRAGRHEPK